MNGISNEFSPSNGREFAREVDMDGLRVSVMERFAALSESQARTKFFAESITSMIRDVHHRAIRAIERMRELEHLPCEIASQLDDMRVSCSKLQQAIDLLADERSRQWHKNGQFIRDTMMDFQGTMDELSKVLIDKSLLERQSRVLGSIILSHERISQWKDFVQEILHDFHAIFPFDFFYTAFAEEHSLSLYLYFMGHYSAESRAVARNRLSVRMLQELHLPTDIPLDIEEFQVLPSHGPDVCDGSAIDMITVAVPEHTPRLSGLLGIAFATTQQQTPQETSIIRSILAVMVMVVGSSRVLSRTLSELEYYSIHDPLTGLYNRRQFNAMLEYETGRSERHHHVFSILLIDLDDFKSINDSYGHPTGDDVLCTLGNLLDAHTRKGDIASRLGGDEFAILLPETPPEGAYAFGEKIRHLIRYTRFESSDHRFFHVTASIGVVSYPRDACEPNDLIAGVDTAMYGAKRCGKDLVYALDHVGDQLQSARDKRDLVETLRQALAERRIVPYFQPIVDTHTGAVYGYETVARLIREDGSTLAAGSFIETIEKYGLSWDLDRSIIDQCFRVMRESLKPGDTTRFFVNLSVQEIQGRGILTFAERLCDELGVLPANVVFEITERDAISDMSHMRKFLSSLSKSGFAFALDDFGSGYNSFHYLRDLRFEYVKVDGIFVRNIVTSKVDYALVDNLTKLCRDLGILTIGEYVESAEILSAIRDMGIDYAQGYHIGMPRPDLNPARQWPEVFGR